MARKAFSDQIRQAIEGSGRSHYSIAKACGIDRGNFSKFMSGQIGLSLEALDHVADLIGLRVVVDLKQKVVNRGQRSK